MGTNGEITSKEISLQAHGRLEGHKAKLVELEILEKEKELVRRPAVLGFLESLGKRLHQVIETFDSVEREERNRLHEVIGETGKEFIRAEGWPMLSLAEIKELRTAFPYLETEPELWGRQRAYDFYERPTAAEWRTGPQGPKIAQIRPDQGRRL